ncbi:WD40 repeat-like protein [Sistotremastrum niveocremeum HHB9708]|uniref:WD40 repeat-like protein n=2 Tax=Sistotremastraceae TaxID=3402574 RepID=A0A164YIU7_9AGAM|nr:WD40 repeat-like protein [Sistotremastrum niveocremeum HHB9708]
MTSTSTNRSSGKAIKRLWGAIASPSKKGKHRAISGHDSLLPLDGEEGELIDDEACFVEEHVVKGIDLISLLPPEISVQIFLYLDVPSVTACSLVSSTWHLIANDNVIWRDLFYRNPSWKINATLARRAIHGSGFSEWTRTRASSSMSSSLINAITPLERAMALASLDENAQSESPTWALNWMNLYKSRLEVDRRWLNGAPKATVLSGHDDSVYCLEFDSQKIITGSRDKTIKIWSMRTGKLRATLKGHEGSVLCLKFDKSGFMVSGSSDRNIFVWDLGMGKEGEGPKVRKVLKGHQGGVLDLRISDEWIVSCSKDTIIRVWNRSTLKPHCSLVGHDGPVNSVGLQRGQVVSASGDGRMMLWDIATGTRIRTFEGHDRGLACIELKDDYIVSGSNDSKIKIWSASTGECLRTLTGHDLLVRALSVDPEAGRLVSASYDKTVKVWDFHTGKLLRDFRNSHTSHIFDVKFDCTRIVSTSHDQKVVILDFAPDLDSSLFL